ncbi:MAG: response regulator transcription factor [Flavobacteriales bacterium]|nr:response regulator transcription factor [Flavobacteriales bacterium]
MSEIKIVLVDDHALIRAGYKSILDDIEDITLIGEAANGEAAIQIVGELKPDVLVLDITMPGKSGLEVAKELRANGSDVKILMLSMHKEEAYIKQSIENGADGYLVKDTDSDHFIQAIRTISTGQKYYGETSTKVLLDSYINQIKNYDHPIQVKQTYNLSKREIEVLGLVTEGLSSGEIGAQLFVSTRTVENHRANIMQKVGVRSVAELINKVIQEGIM